jgi:hypothetical protein
MPAFRQAAKPPAASYPWHLHQLRIVMSLLVLSCISESPVLTLHLRVPVMLLLRRCASLRVKERGSLGRSPVQGQPCDLLASDSFTTGT